MAMSPRFKKQLEHPRTAFLRYKDPVTLRIVNANKSGLGASRREQARREHEQRMQFPHVVLPAAGRLTVPPFYGLQYSDMQIVADEMRRLTDRVSHLEAQLDKMHRCRMYERKQLSIDDLTADEIEEFEPALR